MRAFKEKLMSKLTPKKLLFLAAIALCSLFFYAFGVVTGFFGLRVFSVFWVVTNQTAYYIGYAVLASVTLTGTFIFAYCLYRKFKTKLEAAPLRQKVLVISILTLYGLIFYAVGIATNLFTAPVFSMFWIISHQASIELAYGIGAAAIALSIAILTVYLIKTRKT